MKSGRHFLQVPGPTNVPDRVLRAIAQPTIDHRGPAFAALGREVLDGLRFVFQTTGAVVLYPASGSGGWEAALVNTLSPGDTVLMAETGYFAVQWRDMAVSLGLQVDFLPGDWRHGVDAATVARKLADDRAHAIKAVAVVHNETSTAVTSDIAAVRHAMDAAGHPALLLVDAVSSLGAIDYRHDEWGVDVTVSGSQKGMMLPPGMGFNAISQGARRVGGAPAARILGLAADDLRDNAAGFFPDHARDQPALRPARGGRDAEEEGLANVFARHAASARRRGTRSARGGSSCCVRSGGIQPRADHGGDAGGPRRRRVPRHRARALRHVARPGLGKLKGSVFRIGHLGGFNDLMLAGTLCGVEMGLAAAGVPFTRGGVIAALDYLAWRAAGHTVGRNPPLPSLPPFPLSGCDPALRPLRCERVDARGGAIRAKELSRARSVAAHLARIERVNPRVNAIVTLVAERAMDARARRRRARSRAARRSGRCTGCRSRTRICSRPAASAPPSARRSSATTCRPKTR